MINLIPKTEKKKNVRIFFCRLLVLFFITNGVSFLIAFIAILPAYFSISARNNLLNDKLEAQAKAPKSVIDPKTLLVVKDLNHKLNLVDQAQINKFSVTEKIINAVILTKTSNIKIKNISYDNSAVEKSNSDKTGAKVSIQGSATSREALLAFSRALESKGAFKKVDLPISNFIKGSNIEFYLSLIPQ